MNARLAELSSRWFHSGDITAGLSESKRGSDPITGDLNRCRRCAESGNRQSERRSSAPKQSCMTRHEESAKNHPRLQNTAAESPVEWLVSRNESARRPSRFEPPGRLQTTSRARHRARTQLSPSGAVGQIGTDERTTRAKGEGSLGLYEGSRRKRRVSRPLTAHAIDEWEEISPSSGQLPARAQILTQLPDKLHTMAIDALRSPKPSTRSTNKLKDCHDGG